MSIGPVVGHEQVGAEAAGLVDEPLYLGDRHVRCADHGDARGVQGVDQLGRVVGLGCERQGGHPPEVVDPVAHAVGDLGAGLLLGGSQVHGPDESPPAAVDARAELGGSLFHHAPVRTQHVEAAERRCAQGEQGEAEAAGGSGAGRGDLRSDGDLEAGMGVGAELQTGVAQGEPVCGAVDQLVPGEEGEDRFERLLHHLPLAHRIDAHHEGV